ncbi:hypothetical protein RND81_07G031000 [Saponaria officinalis]|uniref:fructose-bisphosphatase n=1 Tax=Saponaria officinalis TaxID=3572 RepID=A0AAW1JK46_SAPOF
MAALGAGTTTSIKNLFSSLSPSKCPNPLQLCVTESKSSSSHHSGIVRRQRHVVPGVRCTTLGAAAEPETQKRSTIKFEIQTLTGWLLKQEQAGVIDAELTIVLLSISLACKQIASLVQRAGISNLTGVLGATNIQGEDQKKLDVVSNQVFSNCLRSSGHYKHTV